MIGLFFKFGRFWSVRNLDLVLLILVAPGLLLVHFGTAMQAPGYRPLANTPAGEVATEIPFSTNGDQSFSAGVPDTNLREAATTNEPGDSDGRPVDSIAVETDLVEDDDGKHVDGVLRSGRAHDVDVVEGLERADDADEGEEEQGRRQQRQRHVCPRRSRPVSLRRRRSGP